MNKKKPGLPSKIYFGLIFFFLYMPIAVMIFILVFLVLMNLFGDEEAIA